MSESEYLTPKQAAKLLLVEESTLRKWYTQGRLSWMRVRTTPGGQRRYLREDIQRLVDEPHLLGPAVDAAPQSPTPAAGSSPTERTSGKLGKAVSSLLGAFSGGDQRPALLDGSGFENLDDLDDFDDIPEGQPWEQAEPQPQAIPDPKVPTAAEIMQQLRDQVKVDRYSTFRQTPPKQILPPKIATEILPPRPKADDLAAMPGTAHCERYIDYHLVYEYRHDHATLEMCGWEVQDTGSDDGCRVFQYTKEADCLEEILEDLTLVELDVFSWTPETGDYELEVLCYSDGSFRRDVVYAPRKQAG
jgi:excisionase family DNA binding protein